MKSLSLQTVALAALIALPLSLSWPAMAQSAVTTAGTTADNLTDGEIRKVSKDTGKLTIKHGEIKNLDMPPMTMVFTVKDPSVLDKVAVGDKVRFVAIDEGGKLVVTDLQPGK